MANTTNLNLPLIDNTMIADVPRDMNALALALDSAVVVAIDDARVTLIDSANSTSITAAPTANALKTVNDSVVAQLAETVSGAYNAKKFGLIGNGATNDYAALSSLLATIGSSKATIIFPPGTYKLSSNVTIPANITLWIMNGATLSPDSGITITINGGINADLYQIFTGLGNIAGDLKVEAVYPQWWGAVSDGVTDNASAFQKAIDIGRRVIVANVGFGYAISNLTILGNISLVGVGKYKPLLIALPTTTKLFNFKYSGVHVENIKINMNAALVGSITFYFDTNANYFGDIRMSRITIENAYRVITDANDPLKNILHAYFEDIECVTGKGTAIILNNFMGFINFKKVMVSYTNTKAVHGTDVTYPGMIVNKIAGLVLNDCDVLGGTDSVGGDGFVFNNCAAVWFNRVMADTVGGTGIKMTNCMYMYLNDVVSSLCQRGGIYAKSVQTLEVGRLFITGTKGHAGSVLAQDGFYMESCTGGNLGAITTSTNTGNGFAMNNCTNFLINSIRSDNNGAIGVVEQTTAGVGNFNILGNILSVSNTISSLKLVSNANTVSTLIPSSGAVQYHVVGPITI